jgi:ADP-heptose:LPS heptosyltransferase
MHIDTMRYIDYYAGVPLCFVATLLMAVKNWLSKPPATPPKNVLLIELSEMGSAILADPVMEALKRRGARLHFLIFQKNQASLHLLNTVKADNICTLDAGSLWRLLRTTWQFLRWARLKRIDSVIDLELFSRFTALLTALSGAHHRVGFYKFYNEGLYRGELLTRKVAYNPYIHITQNFFSLLHALYATDQGLPFAKVPLDQRQLVLKKATIPAERLDVVRAKITQRAGDITGKPLVLINANASDLLPQRRWSMANFSILIRMILADRDNALVLLTGAPDEYPYLEELRAHVNGTRCLNFAGAVEFLELPALYAVSTLMVTNDSGPAHFAAVTSLPTFVLFGPETPALYGPLGNTTALYAGLHCSPCVSAWNHRRTPCQDNKCLQVITPQAVFAAIKPVLDRHAPPGPS